jgi:hypothetical protein
MDTPIKCVSGPRDDPHIMACGGHQLGMVRQNGFDASNHRRCGIMQDGDFHLFPDCPNKRSLNMRPGSATIQLPAMRIDIGSAKGPLLPV